MGKKEEGIGRPETENGEQSFDDLPENTKNLMILEKCMSQILRQNGLWFWELDLVNHRMERFANGNLLGTHVESIPDVPESLFRQRNIIEEDWDVCRNMFAELYRGKEQVKAQYRSWSSKHQDYIWYEYNFSLIEKKNGVPVRAVGTSRDISAQKRLEQLYKEEQKNLLVADDSLIASSRVNLSKGLVESLVIQGKDDLTESVVDLLDYRERTAVYLDDIQISDKDNYDLSVEQLYRMYRAGVQEFEKHYVARKKGDGQSICIRVNCKLLARPASGDIIAFFYNRDETLTNISELTMNTVLQKNYEMMAILFVHTKQYRVINEGKWPNASLKGTVDYSAELEEFSKCLKEENRKVILEQVELERILYMLREKSLYTVECDMLNGDELRRKQIRFSYADKERNIILIARMDIHDVVQNEREKQHRMEDALNLAERANNAKSEFLATISHEIRTPLNAIIGMTQLASEEADNPKAVLEYIDEIRLSGRHLLNLINNVLDMSKIESGEISLHPQRYPFAELHRNVSTMFTPLCDQKNIKFVTLNYGEQPDMLVDKMRLNQVIFNLLNNAVKYTRTRGEIQFITLNHCQENSMETKFIVKDNGIGISKEFQEQMFQPFTQENNATVTSSQGTGLGLSISKGIVDKMGGEMTVTSVIGRGTTFCVRIRMPIAKGYRAKIKDTRVQEADFSGRRILVVEDHNLNQVIITRLLKNRGGRRLWLPQMDRPGWRSLFAASRAVLTLF